MQLIFFISSLFLFLPFLLSAQAHWVCSGQVVDEATQEPLVGANIYTKDFKYGTTTNEYGRYTIQVGEDITIKP